MKYANPEVGTPKNTLMLEYFSLVKIVAKKIANGTVTRSRPLCPYPQVARYKGQGSLDDAASFECRAP